MSDLAGLKSPVSADQALMQKRLETLKAAQKNPAKIKDVSEDFEAMFVYFMLRSMRKTVMKSGLFQSGLQGDIWESMFDQELSKSIARSSPLGVAEMLQKQLAPAADPLSRESITGSLFPATLDTRAIANQLKAQGIIRQNSRPDRRSIAAGAHAITPAQQKKLAEFNPSIEAASRRHKVDPDLIRSVILAESGGNPQAVSSKGARGLMQLMDATAREMRVSDSMQPRDNIMGGSRYLALMIDRFKGDYQKALAAYNAGPSTVEKYRGIPPFPETRAYVRKVLDYFSQFKALR